MSSAQSGASTDPLPSEDQLFAQALGGGRRRRRREPASSDESQADLAAVASGAAAAVAPPPVQPAPGVDAPAEMPQPVVTSTQATPPRVPLQATAAQTTPSQPAPNQAAPIQTAQAMPAPLHPVAAPPPLSVASAPEPGQDPFAPTSVLIGHDVAEGFEYYQSVEKRDTGAEPSNTAVLLRALNHCYGRYEALLAQRRRPEETSNLPFPGHAPTRRAVAGKRSTEQLAIRPTRSEMAQIDRFVDESGARSRSEFVDVVLQTFFRETVGEVPRSFKRKRRG